TAVLHEPELLILDEPWSGLDPINAEVLFDIVREQKRAGRTILFSTHLMDQAERICDEVCIIARARKVLQGSVSALKRAASRERMLAVVFGGRADAERAAHLLSDRTLVAGVREHASHCEVELADGVRAPRLLERLVAQGIELRRFEVLEPTLQQIFV